jgi:glycosyltransferase involved in cell wall biosynthesis
VRGIAGSERHLLDLLARLPDLGVEARMCVLRVPGAETFLEALEERRIERAELEAGRDANPLLVARLRREIRAFDADLVHTHLIHADLHGQLAARIARVPGVVSMHGVHGFFAREPLRSAERLALRSARRVIAISEHAAAFLRRHGLGHPDRIRVVPYGIDADRWRSFEEDRARARSWFGIDEDAFVVGMAARLIPGKGHALAAEAVAIARRADPRIRLFLVGTGPLEDELRVDAAASGGAVSVLGFVEDVPGFMAACDVVVVPTESSLGEGFGLVALEAMAAGRPVVATRVASLPEVVGDAGVVVPPGDAAALAEAIARLARDEDERRDRGAAGADRARSVYPIDAMVKATTDVYAEALAG